MKTTLKFELKNGKKIEMSEDIARELYFKMYEYFGCKNYPVHIPYHEPLNPLPWDKTWIITCNTGTYNPNKLYNYNINGISGNLT